METLSEGLNKLVDEVKIYLKREEDKKFLEIKKPILFYRFKDMEQLDNFISAHNLKDIDVNIIITKKEFHEIISLKCGENDSLFIIDYEEGINRYKGYKMIIL